MRPDRMTSGGPTTNHRRYADDGVVSHSIASGQTLDHMLLDTQDGLHLRRVEIYEGGLLRAAFQLGVWGHPGSYGYALSRHVQYEGARVFRFVAYGMLPPGLSLLPAIRVDRSWYAGAAE